MGEETRDFTLGVDHWVEATELKIFQDFTKDGEETGWVIGGRVYWPAGLEGFMDQSDEWGSRGAEDGVTGVRKESNRFFWEGFKDFCRNQIIARRLFSWETRNDVGNFRQVVGFRGKTQGMR